MRVIKHLREKKRISQAKLADEIDVSPRTIQLYERENANIPIKNLTKIAEYFELSIAELYLQEFNDFRRVYNTKKQSFTKFGSVFYPLDYGKFLVMAPLILMEEHERYTKNISNGKAEKNIFQIGFVIDSAEETTHRAFEISGDSMNDNSIHGIPNKSIVLGLDQNKEDFTSADNPLWNQAYILVCKDRIMCKQITGFDPKKACIQCHNLNPSPEYQDFELALKDVLQIFKIVKKQI